MPVVSRPPRSGNYPDRGLDCEFAIEPAFQHLAHQAEAEGWTARDVAYALIKLAGAHLAGVLDDELVDAQVWVANALDDLRLKPRSEGTAD